MTQHNAKYKRVWIGVYIHSKLLNPQWLCEGVWLVTLIASREPSPFRLIWGLKLPESALCVRMLLSVLSREKM